MDAAFRTFQDDFARFRARGAIGGISLTVVPPHPELGDWVEVRSHGLAAGRIVASDGRHWPVEQGVGLRFRIQAAMSWTLCDASGAVMDSARVVPTAAVPVLRDWGIPDQVDYAHGLPIQVLADHAESVEIAWRNSPDGEWQQLGRQPCELPVPARQGHLHVRAVMRSRHAGLAAEATQTVARTVEVVHPQPQWRWDAPGEVARFERARWLVSANWIRSVRLEVGGTRHQAQGNARLQQIDAPMAADAVGEIVADLHIEDLHGNRHHQRIAVTVRPREFNCRAAAQPDGTVSYRIDGAAPVSLEIPDRGFALPLQASAGRIRHGFSLPTLALLVCLDDAGQTRRHPITLDAAAHHWGAVRPMRSVRWLVND